MWAFKLIYPLLITVALLTCRAGIQAADLSEASSLSEFVMGGMRAERDAIRSGIVTITGSRSENGKAWGTFNVNVKYVVSFDYDKNLFRFDESDYRMVWADSPGVKPVDESMTSNLPEGKDASGRKWVTVESGGALVRTNEYDLVRGIDSTMINRLPAGVVNDTSVHVFDVRALGLMGLIEFQQGKTVDVLLNVMDKIHMTIEPLQSPKGYRCEYSNTELKQEFWIDETKGMSPFRWQTTRSGQVTFQSDTEWKAIDNIWLPSTYTMTDKNLTDVEKSWHLVFEWDQVNLPLDPQLFTAAGLATDENAAVVDLTLGMPVLEPAFPMPLPKLPPMKPVNPNSRSRWGWIILANVVGGGVAWWFFRRRAKSQAP